MTHLPRQQGLVLEGFLKFGVCVLTFDGNAEQTGKTCQKIRIGVVELSGIWTIRFEDTEGRIAFATPSDQNVDRTFDAMFGQELRRSETRLFLQVIGDYRLPCLKGKAGGRFDIRAECYIVYGTSRPTNASAHNQTLFIRKEFQNLGV